MPGKSQQGSIFSHKLDRVAFTAYFLGAVVPLLALAFVVERFALPTLQDSSDAVGLIALVLSIGFLSFGSFLVLRRTTRHSLDQMDEDNHRLASLLEASGQLAAASDPHDVAATVARAAHALARASASFVLMRSEPGRPLELVASEGKEALKRFEARSAELVELANLALSQGAPGTRARGEGSEAAAAVPIRGEGGPDGALLALQDDAEALTPEQVNALTTLSRLASVALHNADLRDSQRNFFVHVTDLLVNALDSHLGYHSGHSQRVASLANHVGRALDLDEHRLHRLHFGALLHDIGLLKLDRSMHKNPTGCQKHAALGARMLGRIRVWQDIAPIVHHHHEWWDGSGYPDALAGDAIPLESRIIALCDAWDTITSEKSYKPAMQIDDAVREIRRCTGTQFDPRAAEVLLELVERGEIGA